MYEISISMFLCACRIFSPCFGLLLLYITFDQLIPASSFCLMLYAIFFPQYSFIYFVFHVNYSHFSLFYNICSVILMFYLILYIYLFVMFYYLFSHALEFSCTLLLFQRDIFLLALFSKPPNKHFFSYHLFFFFLCFCSLAKVTLKKSFHKV